MKALEILIGSKDNVTYLLQSGKLNSYENKKYENRLKFINEAIEEFKDIEGIKTLKNRSCENCKTISECSILRKVVKDRLRKDGYLMSQKEFDCRFWESK